MATNLQVNANTQTAVGAFNALAASIQGARNQFQAIGSATNTAANAANRAATSYRALNGSFTQLTSSLNSAYTLLRNVAGAVEFMFGALLKELDKLQGFQAIMSVTTKSSEEAAKSYSFLRKTADQLGVQVDALTSNYAKLVASLPQGTEGIKIAQNAFLGLARAARTLHASNSDTQLMFYAITQMASKGVVSMEELRRQLGEKLPGVMEIAARAVNTTPELLEAAIRKGTVNSIKFLQYFADELNRTFKEPAEKAAQSVDAAFNRLKNVWVDFVQSVLDSGGGQAIANLFDAIREKLSDPYVIEQFSNFVKLLADRFTEMVKSLSQADIRQGFDTLYKGISAGITLLEKFVGLLQWIINNGTAAGAIVGAVGGALVGARAGPYGALVGGVAGAGLGAYAGNSLKPSAAETAARKAADEASRAAALSKYTLESGKRQELELFKMTELIPKLQQFKALNGLSGLDNLMKAENLNTATIADLNKILSSPKYGTDKAKLDALMKYNADLGTPDKSTAKLSDILGAGKSKQTAEERSMTSTAFKAAGFQSTFSREYQNLRKLLDMGRLTEQQYNQGVDQLLSKQPVIVKAMKEQREHQAALNKATTEYITYAIKQTQFKEDFNEGLRDQLELSVMSADQARIESQIISDRNRHEQAGLILTRQRQDELRETYALINKQQREQAAADSMRQYGPDRFRGLTDQLNADRRLRNDPAEGYTRLDSRMFFAKEMPDLFSGTTVQLEALTRSFEDMYLVIDQLRKNDVINEGEAIKMKSQQAELYRQQIIAAQVQISQKNLELGTGTWADMAITVLGRLAQGFTTFAAGASQTIGDFYTKFTDGFANSVGRAIVYAEDLGAALKSVAKDALAQLISSFVKLGIQMLAKAILGDAIAASSTAASAAMGATVAAAWAPAAAMVSLASFGANSVPAMTGIAATAALSQALALPGFKYGGYTGNAPLDAITGVTHGKEFVVNAAATARNRPALEAMNAGANVSGGGVTVLEPRVIVNTLPGETADVRSRQGADGQLEIEVSVRRSVMADISEGGPISTQLERRYGLNRATGASY